MTDPYNNDAGQQSQPQQPQQPTQPQSVQQPQPASVAQPVQQATQQQAPVPPQAANQGYQASQQPYQQQTYQQASYQQPYQQAYQQTSYQAPVNPAQPAKEPKKMSPNVKTFGIAFAGAALACVIGIGGFSVANGVKTGNGTTVTLGAATNTEITAQDSDDSLAETVASKALPSVAAIDVYTEDTSSTSLFGYGYGSNGSSSSSSDLTESSLGSGVVLSEDGYIVTNNHVIEGAAALKVTVGGEEYDADVVGTDESSDIAVVKLRDASGLTPIELGDSDNLTIGEWVMSIGSPFGLEQSVATGIVSATSRSQIMSNSSSSSGSDGYGYGYGNGSSSSSSSSGYTIYPNLIQTDAAINPGNSGGALVDKNGKLIGINTLITSYSGNYSGVGFAIPVNYAVNIAQQIIEGKTPTHAQLGVTLSTVNSQNSKRYGLSVDSGAYVTGVSSDSGAATAGLQAGDIVTKFEGNKVESASDLMLDVRSKNPGDTVTIEVNRDGETKTMQVTLGSDESSETSSSSSSTQKNNSSSNSNESLLNRLFNNGSSSSSKSDAA